MATFGPSDDLKGAEFNDTDLSGARFVGADLSGAVMRGVVVENVEIDSPWLVENDNVLLVNGIDVIPYVDAELNRRFPGRELHLAATPEGLREAWAALQRAWAALLERAASMPEGTVDVSIGGEWSFAQTLRHLVLATDTWLRKAIHQVEQPYHPIGQTWAGGEEEMDMSVFRTDQPTYDEVLEVRAERQAMVRDFLATITADQLAEKRANPHSPDREVTVIHCLHTITEEEWEHLRYATRDLDAIEAGSPT